MTNITIKKNVKLNKTHFEDAEELQMALMLAQQNEFELTQAHQDILLERVARIDAADHKGDSWSEVKKRISRKSV